MHQVDTYTQITFFLNTLCHIFSNNILLIKTYNGIVVFINDDISSFGQYIMR